MSGGCRKGAGRPIGTSLYGEPTKAIRVPVSLIQEIEKRLNEMTKCHQKKEFKSTNPFKNKLSFVYQLEKLNIRHINLI